MASLVAIKGPSAGKTFALDKECTLGRSLGSDIYIGDLNVSRRHARIVLTVDGAYEIEDLGSGNGTRVNEQPITRYRLEPNDIINIGGSAFRYEAAQRKAWSDQVLTVVAQAVALTSVMEAQPPRPAAHAPHEDRTGPLPVLPTRPQGTTTAAPPAPPGAVGPSGFAGLTEGRAATMLEAMVAVADGVATEMDLPKLLDKILDHLFEVFPQADRGFVLLVNPATGQLVPEAVKQRSAWPGEGLRFSHTIVDQMMASGAGMIRGRTLPPMSAPLPPGKAGLRGELSHALGAEPIEGGAPQMGAPLVCGGQNLGTVHLEARAGARSFSKEGLALLQAIARQAAVAIASARAGQELLARQRLDDDLRLARQIQRSFLPQRLNQVSGLEFETHYAPANQVGGDFYDIIPVGPGRVGILVGDISGHGVSAALLMAKVATDIRLLACTAQSPSEVMTRANRTLLESGQEGMFATVAFLLVDIHARTLTLANAGHQPPLVVSSRFAGWAELEEASVALGVLPDMDYPQKVYELLPGDVVLLYTDGVNEAMNRYQAEYGMERLRSAITQQSPPDPHALVERVLADVRRFVGGAAQNDDITLVAFGLSRQQTVTRPRPI